LAADDENRLIPWVSQASVIAAGAFLP